MTHRRTPRSPRSGRFALGAIVAVGALALGACGEDDDGESMIDDDTESDDGGDTVDRDDVERDEYGVGLYNAGGDEDTDESDEGTDGGGNDRIHLPVAYEVGQSSATTAEMAISLDIDIGGMNQDVEMTMVMHMAEEVTEVADGVATVEMSIDDVELLDAPPEVSPEDMAAEFDAITGEVVVVEYSESGVQIGQPELKDGGSLPPSLADSFDQAVGMEAFPSEPIGVGARWSSLDEVESEGITVEGETFYELVELTDDGYVIEITQDIPLDETVDGVQMSGSFTSTGEIRGDRTNPLLLDMTYEQDGSFEMSGDGEVGSMNTGIVVDMTSE